MLSFKVIDGEVNLIEYDRYLEEEAEFHYLIADAIAGKRTTLMFDTVRECKWNFNHLVKTCRSMGVVFDGARFRDWYGIIHIGNGGIACIVESIARTRRGWDGGWERW